MKYFDIQELVPQYIYARYMHAADWFIDPRLGVVLDELREQVGHPVYVNTGKHDQRGFRS